MTLLETCDGSYSLSLVLGGEGWGEGPFSRAAQLEASLLTLIPSPTLSMAERSGPHGRQRSDAVDNSAKTVSPIVDKLLSSAMGHKSSVMLAPPEHYPNVGAAAQPRALHPQPTRLRIDHRTAFRRLLRCPGEHRPHEGPVSGRLAAGVRHDTAALPLRQKHL
jgi:hypothetical protein